MESVILASAIFAGSILVLNKLFSGTASSASAADGGSTGGDAGGSADSGDPGGSGE